MAPSSPPTGKNNRVVVIGGGYAGVAAARAAEKSSPDVEVTLVTSRELFLHYISGLRASVNSSWKERTLIPYDGVLARGKVISGATVTGLNAVERTISTDTGISVAYDYLILATGYLSNKTAGGVGNAVHASDMKGAYAFRMEKIKAAERILVAGGGPVGVEMAGEIAWTFPEKKITLVSSKDLMESKVTPFRNSFKRSLQAHLESMGVKVHINAGKVQLQELSISELGVIEGTHLYEWNGADGESAGGKAEADLCIVAVGAGSPSNLYSDSGLEEWLDDAGRLKVDETYAVEGTEGRVFAVGDCSNSPTASASGYMAGISATNLAKNIALSRAGKPLKRLHSKPKPMALVSIGPKLGAAQIGSITFGSFFTRNLKGTDLVCSKTWKDMGAGKPPAA